MIHAAVVGAISEGEEFIDEELVEMFEFMSDCFLVFFLEEFWEVEVVDGLGLDDLLQPEKADVFY